MSAKPQGNVICTNCRHTFQDTYKKSFLGFRKYKCPACGAEVLYPLVTSHLVIYLIVIVALGAISTFALTRGIILIPGIPAGAVAVGGIIAISKDISIRQRIKELKHGEQKGEPPNLQV